MAEPVVDKEKANFCEYFCFSDKIVSVKKTNIDPLKDLKRLFSESQ